MEEIKLEQEQAEQEQAQTKEQLKTYLEEVRQKQKEAREALMAGKGRLRLEKPFEYMEQEIEELVYDFTELTGMEYADAMDIDASASNAFRSTYKQNLALFAQAAAKQTPGLDMQDILERIGITDAVEGAQLAALFFNASTRAGQMRISKK